MHAIIGCGRVALNHVDAVNALDKQIKWACDSDIEIAEAFAAKYSIPNFTNDLDDILRDSEVTTVSVCTPHNTHAEITIAALENSKDVIVEKPVATSLEDANKMMQTARDTGRILCVISQHRYDALVQKIKDFFSKGIFGTVATISGTLQCNKDEEYYALDSWRGKQESEGGSSLINQAIHTLDQMMSIAGTPKVLSAVSRNYKFEDLIETEDTLITTLEFPGGALGSLVSTNTSTIEWKSMIEIVGTKGSVSFTTGFPVKITYINIDGEYSEELIKELHDIEEQRDPAPIGNSYYGSSHRKQIADFFKVVHNGGSLLMDPAESVTTLGVVLDIYESCKVNSDSKLEKV